MKIAAAVLLAPSAVAAFTRSATFVVRTETSLKVGSDPNVFTGGNTWKPDSEKMGSTDTGDYYPEGYNPQDQPAYSEGMGGSQAMLGGGGDGPQLPGMENLGEDAIMMGGIEMAEGIPEGMEFVPSSVPDGTVDINVASSSSGSETFLLVNPVCMTFEDFFCAFAPGSHPSLSVEPATGRMDRRGGEPTELCIKVVTGGQAGQWQGDLVINLPEDNSKICYKVNVNSF
eukprot:CAMPEP_0194043870 /NCGR_PEP_ID=MMETSP0009_2-20130614/15431_1 /TAXON_ID=210454 /ORGANISM="Grammatophora oceanica, Strain CCMP 410" /LENGTH=227 /DNA_ID=CAMNT_0038688233 /DNA_START=54 /DNA_END=737 /DNA_ORIENTATION=+